MKAVWIRQWFPGLYQFKDYQRGWLTDDVRAAFSVVAVALPVAIAYAQLTVCACYCRTLFVCFAYVGLCADGHLTPIDCGARCRHLRGDCGRGYPSCCRRYHQALATGDDHDRHDRFFGAYWRVGSNWAFSPIFSQGRFC